MIKILGASLCTISLVACAPQPNYRSNFVEPSVVGVMSAGPANAPAGTCWGRDETPATVETLTQIIQQTPETRDETGTLIRPATYRTVQSQRIVEGRDDIWFETPCPDQIDAVFVLALQRALKLRGLFAGDATGMVDQATIDGIRAFQRTLDLNSGQLSLVAARKLGIVAYSRDDIQKF